MANIVAIVGRPNVGKSTFFNRMIQKREAIVDSQSGVTRDRHYGKSDWNGKKFTLIDTGGYLKNSDDIFQKEIDKQVKLAIQESDSIIFMVDVEDGVTAMDQTISQLLRKAQKPIFIAVNKTDNSKRLENSLEFYSMGFDSIFPISAINGSGSGELLDALVNTFNEDSEDEINSIPRFSVVGRPNSGKSSFINALIGEERYIVTDEAGTTRDSIDTKYNRFGFEFNLVDTAGIRRKSKVKEDIEFYSVMRSIRAIENSDVCVLLFDATREFDSQVQNIFWLVQRNKKGVVILINKWDLIKKNTSTTKDMELKIKKEISPFDDVPLLFISVINKQRIYKAIELAVEVYKNRSRKIITRKLNDLMLPIIEKFPPPSTKGRFIKIKFCTQIPSKHPQFAFFSNHPNLIKEPYRRFLENQLRKNFNFRGVPISIFFRKK